MDKNLLTASAATLAMALTVASCGNASDPKLSQTGQNPDLPKVNETLIPAMKISPPSRLEWRGADRSAGLYRQRLRDAPGDEDRCGDCRGPRRGQGVSVCAFP